MNKAFAVLLFLMATDTATDWFWSPVVVSYEREQPWGPR